VSDTGRPTALVTAPFRGEGLDLLNDVCDVIADPWLVPGEPMRLLDPAKLAARIDETGATVVICEADMCMGEVLERPLLAIGSSRGDPTNVDVEGATQAGIPVLHAPGRNADGVAEVTVALLLAVTRHLIQADRDVREGEVFRGGTIPYQRFRAWELNGRTAGLVGLGAVGQATKWRLEGLGMNVIAHDPFNDEAEHSLDALLAEADVVSMHAAVTPENIGMMNSEKFELMHPDAVFVNSARAALHDLDDLTDALASGQIGAAALDHFEGEQLPEGHPLLMMPNTVLAPHIGGATYNTEANHSLMIASDIAALLRGERPVRCANPEVLS
jgi:D-3-phosphoglycerate dehydrogenase